MQAHDRELVARDWALPGLGVVLEPERLLELLQTAWPEHALRDPRLTYLRYKPGTNCLAAYALLVDGESTFVHATAHRANEPEKLHNARKKFRGESALEPVVLPRHVAVRAFPTDRKLASLKCLTDPAARRKLLRDSLPGRPELWEADLVVLRYKPERRLVARLRDAPPLQVPVHGNFSAVQVLETPEGVAIIDFDAAALGDPAWDLGTFAVQLELDALRGTLEVETAVRIRAAFEDGYAAARGALPPHTALYTAAGLLRLAPLAFRTRQLRWPEETRALIVRAEALL